ncbi:MAG TPA: class I SAM-dependent methyltransferase [Gemmatimonadaceae bacterium]
MPITNSDRDWERFGQTDPYFAVLTAPEFHGQPTGDARAKFFESGEAHIEAIFSIIRERLYAGFAPQRALDFGCGVGRLLIPLAARCREVTGVDVSPSMLAEARRNCDAAGAANVELVQGDDELSRVAGTFDFVHSYIVLQHIPVERGERLISKLASVISDGGVGMFQVPYSTGRTSFLSRAVYWARTHVPAAKWVLNIARRRRPDAPVMEMNAYAVTRLLDILRDAGCREAHVRFSDHTGARGVLLFARKSDAPVFL